MLTTSMSSNTFVRNMWPTRGQGSVSTMNNRSRLHSHTRIWHWVVVCSVLLLLLILCSIWLQRLGNDLRLSNCHLVAITTIRWAHLQCSAPAIRVTLYTNFRLDEMIFCWRPIWTDLHMHRSLFLGTETNLFIQYSCFCSISVWLGSSRGRHLIEQLVFNFGQYELVFWVENLYSMESRRVGGLAMPATLV